jgi:hypothetical protein
VFSLCGAKAALPPRSFSFCIITGYFGGKTNRAVKTEGMCTLGEGTMAAVDNKRTETLPTTGRAELGNDL